MFDCDFPTVEYSSKPFLLWKMYFFLKTSFYFFVFSDNLGTESEKESYSFLPPMPERGSGIHRVVAIILKNYNYQPTDRE